jgi:hypothetical protein
MKSVVALFLCAVVIYVFSTGAHTYSVDELTNYASARAFVQTGSPDIRSQVNNPFPSSRLLKVEHPDKPRITGRYGLLAWLSMVPAYAIASVFSPAPEEAGPAFPSGGDILPLTSLLFNPVISGMLVALIYLLSRALGMSPWCSLTAAIISGFASPIWVYAGTLSSIPLATAFHIASVLALVHARTQHRNFMTLLSGLLFGLAVSTRPDYLMFVPVLLIAVCGIKVIPFPATLWRVVIWILGWGIVVVPGVGLYNLYRTGDLFEFGYGSQTFLWATERAHIGIFGILASSGFGLFVYLPVSVLGLWGLLSCGLSRWSRWTMVSPILVSVLVYGTFNDWEGGVSWGPRYLTSVVPFLMVGIGCLLWKSRMALSAQFSIGLLSVWGAGISVLGILFDYQRGWRNLWDVGARPDQIIWDPHFSPIGAHLRLLRQWLDGSIGPDLYVTTKIGILSLPIMLCLIFIIVFGLATNLMHVFLGRKRFPN